MYLFLASTCIEFKHDHHSWEKSIIVINVAESTRFKMSEKT